MQNIHKKNLNDPPEIKKLHIDEYPKHVAKVSILKTSCADLLPSLIVT